MERGFSQLTGTAVFRGKENLCFEAQVLVALEKASQAGHVISYGVHDTLHVPFNIEGKLTPFLFSILPIDRRQIPKAPRE